MRQGFLEEDERRVNLAGSSLRLGGRRIAWWLMRRSKKEKKRGKEEEKKRRKRRARRTRTRSNKNKKKPEEARKKRKIQKVRRENWMNITITCSLHLCSNEATSPSSSFRSTYSQREQKERKRKKRKGFEETTKNHVAFTEQNNPNWTDSRDEKERAPSWWTSLFLSSCSLGPFVAVEAARKEKEKKRKINRSFAQTITTNKQTNKWQDLLWLSGEVIEGELKGSWRWTEGELKVSRRDFRGCRESQSCPQGPTRTLRLAVERSQAQGRRFRSTPHGSGSFGSPPGPWRSFHPQWLPQTSRWRASGLGCRRRTLPCCASPQIRSYRWSSSWRTKSLACWWLPGSHLGMRERKIQVSSNAKRQALLFVCFSCLLVCCSLKRSESLVLP